MAHSKEKTTVGATVTTAQRERIKEVAAMKRWSVAQTLGLFIETYWEEWERSIGVGAEPALTKPSKSKPKSS